MTPPYSYEQINAHVSPVTPSVMHTKGNGLSYYFRKYLFLISIHALLAESDQLHNVCCRGHYRFLSTLSLRRATVAPSAFSVSGF